MSGLYPPGLEEDLAEHFRRIVSNRLDANPTVVRERLRAVNGSMGFDSQRISKESKFPGGRFIHKLMGKIVARQTQGIFEQVNQYAQAVYSALEAIEQYHSSLLGEVEVILDRLAEYEKVPDDAGPHVRELSRRVTELEAARAREDFVPWFTQERFGEEFRGTYEEIQDRYRGLARRLEGFSPVLDIGCGRGEMLELLREIGVEAYGVELDADLVKLGIERDLKVEHCDGVAHLSTVMDGSLGAVVLIQVVEHLIPQQLVELVALCSQKIRPGGRVVVETINPQSLYVFAHSLYLDPTHTGPVHPVYLMFLFREAGFKDIEIDWRSPPPNDDVLQTIDEGSDASASALNANIDRLNKLLFAPQDYALFATR